METKQKNSKDGMRVREATTALCLASDPTRFRILELLIKEREGLCVYQIADAIGISHSAASHQLAKLEAHAVVEGFRHGQTMCYMLKNTDMSKKLQKLLTFFS